MIGNTSVVLWPLELLFPDPLFTILFLLSLSFALPESQAYSKQNKQRAFIIGIHSNYKLICIAQDFNNSFGHLRLLYLEVQYIEVCERKVNFSSLWISFSSRYYILDGGLVDSSWKHPKKKRKQRVCCLCSGRLSMVEAHWSWAYPRVFADASNIITCVCFERWIFVHGSCNYLRIRIQEDLVGII